jgi:2-phosphosulfolactate phosphatase
MTEVKPKLHTSLSPALLDLYDLEHAVVVIVDVLRATSTIATALFNGARCVIPVDSVTKCIQLGKQIEGITAGERDGKIAEGLAHGNSPYEYSREFIANKTLVLTTTNGTKLLHMALERGASRIVTGSFCNLDSVCRFLLAENRPVVLACAAWKDRVNIEDALFAGAVISNIRDGFSINCDSSQIAETLYQSGKKDLFEFMKRNQASHFRRLMGFGLEKDIRYCLSLNQAGVPPFYEDGKLVVHKAK